MTRTVDDFKPYCRGQQVCVQLKGPMLMCERGHGGDIELMSVPEENQQVWTANLVRGFTQSEGREPSPEEVQQLITEIPVPVRPVPVPVYIGSLEVLGSFLIGSYEDASGRKVMVTIDPDDIKHVTVLESSLVT